MPVLAPRAGEWQHWCSCRPHSEEEQPPGRQPRAEGEMAATAALVPQSRGGIDKNDCQDPWLTAVLTHCDIPGLDHAVML